MYGDRFLSTLALFAMAMTLLCAIGSWFDGEGALALFFLVHSLAFLFCKTLMDNSASKHNG